VKHNNILMITLKRLNISLPLDKELLWVAGSSTNTYLNNFFAACRKVVSTPVNTYVMQSNVYVLFPCSLPAPAAAQQTRFWTTSFHLGEKLCQHLWIIYYIIRGWNVVL